MLLSGRLLLKGKQKASRTRRELVAGPEWRHEEATRTAPQAGRTPRTQEMRRT